MGIWDDRVTMSQTTSCWANLALPEWPSTTSDLTFCWPPFSGERLEKRHTDPDPPRTQSEHLLPKFWGMEVGTKILAACCCIWLQRDPPLDSATPDKSVLLQEGPFCKKDLTLMVEFICNYIQMTWDMPVFQNNLSQIAQGKEPP